MENKNEKGYFCRSNNASDECYDVSCRHEWLPERFLVLLSDSRYRQDVGRFTPTVPVCIVVARMTCTEECTHGQKGSKDGIH
jgi:hypothetical protein